MPRSTPLTYVSGAATRMAPTTSRSSECIGRHSCSFEQRGFVVAVIEARELVKEFSRPEVAPGRFSGLRRMFSTRKRVTRAVDGVSFDIERGELVGYLGPNGAGKSTTIKMLTGILTPSSGICRVGGTQPSRDRVANAPNIGVVFGQRSQLWYDLPLRDSFEVLADLYDIDQRDYRQRMGLFTEMLALTDFLDTPARSLSLGQRMRGDLVAAMLHAPSLLFLDEPTVGLDVVAKTRMLEFIAETNRSAHTTIVLTTHDMEDVERLCRRIIVIDSGRVIYDGDLAALKARYMPHRFLVLTLDEVIEPGPCPIPLDGTQRLLESAHVAGVERVVIASSHHVAGNYQRADADAVEDGRPVLSAGIRPRPDTYYGVSKAAMEALGSLYADQFGMHIVAIRIGTTAKPPLRGRQNLIWISYRDLAATTEAALGDLSAPAQPGFAVWRGVSRNTGSSLAHEPASSAGFAALDDASTVPSAPLADEPARLGGTWTQLALGQRP